MGEASNRRILVVEDEELVREALTALLVEHGYEVSVAVDGHDALECLHAGPLPDLILLDLRMPVMNGWEFRAIQKEDPRLSVIPVVAMSADESPQAVAVSAHTYLHKPIPSDRLLSALEHALAEVARASPATISERERLDSLSRLAANIGHEINNPLAIVMMNLGLSVEELHPLLKADATSAGAVSPEHELDDTKGRVSTVLDMLQDCQTSSERIRTAIQNLVRLPGLETACTSLVDLRNFIGGDGAGRRISVGQHPVIEHVVSPIRARRGRVLVIDDELVIGELIHVALKDEHDVVAVRCASDGLTRLEKGEDFDLILCDVIMPSMDGLQFQALVGQRWPELLARITFITAGGFPPPTLLALNRSATPVLLKPFEVPSLNRLIETSIASRC